MEFLLAINQTNHLSPNQQAPRNSTHYYLVQAQYNLLHHPLCRTFHLGVKSLHHQLQSKQKGIGPTQQHRSLRLTSWNRPFPSPSKCKWLLHGILKYHKGYYLLYPKTFHIKITFNLYICEYYINIKPEESIYYGALMIQEYPSGV